MNNHEWPEPHEMSELPGDIDSKNPERLVLIECKDEKANKKSFEFGMNENGVWRWRYSSSISGYYWTLLRWYELPKLQEKPRARAMLLEGKWKNILACKCCPCCIQGDKNGGDLCGFSLHAIKRNEIEKNCPLPFHHDVRDHTPDEIPGSENGKNPERRVIVKYINEQFSDGTHHHVTAIYYYGEWCDIRKVPIAKYRKIISWNEIL